MDDSTRYDPNVVIEQAHALNWQQGQLVFQSALLEWVDDCRENTTNNTNSNLPEAIATLWLAYAQYLANFSQYKSAMEAYEQASQCPVAGKSGRVWLEYARFALERNKPKKAQDIYLQALVGNSSSDNAMDEQDQQMLWYDFLDMMQQHNNNPNLTMQELKNEAYKQVTTTTAEQPATKRPKNDDERRHVVTPEAVQEQAALVASSNTIPPEIQAAWMARDGHANATIPEPPLWEPTPPKLRDATGLELLDGDVELTLALNKLLSTKHVGTLVLETCRALWTMYALKQLESAKALENLDATLQQQYDTMQANLDARLSVAGAAASAVIVLNQQEQNEFVNRARQQRDAFCHQMAWDFRKLLWQQQSILGQLNVIPNWEGPSVQEHVIAHQANICKFLHSAFYLRKRIGEEPHVKMLNNQATKLEKELEQYYDQQQQYDQPQQYDQQQQHYDQLDQQQQYQQGAVSFPPPPPPPPPPLPPNMLPPPPYPQTSTIPAPVNYAPYYNGGQNQ